MITSEKNFVQVVTFFIENPLRSVTLDFSWSPPSVKMKKKTG
jgi:hypothetical protein